jgi:hypothetical protein
MCETTLRLLGGVCEAGGAALFLVSNRPIRLATLCRGRSSGRGLIGDEGSISGIRTRQRGDDTYIDHYSEGTRIQRRETTADKLEPADKQGDERSVDDGGIGRNRGADQPIQRRRLIR